MNYSETITLTVPNNLADIASAIGRAMDPDTGGADSFRHPVMRYQENGEPAYDIAVLTTTTACTPEFKQQALAMLADPNLLFGACQADYAARWSDLTPPSLTDCQSFCSALTIS